MPAPTEHKTVQDRILSYAQEIGWSFVSREEAEVRRGNTGGTGAPPSKDLPDAVLRALERLRHR